MVESRDLEYLQDTLNVLIVIFRQYGLVANVAKSKVMSFQTGTLISRMLEDVVGQQCMGGGDTYSERLIRWIPCPDYRLELTAG